MERLAGEMGQIKNEINYLETKTAGDSKMETTETEELFAMKGRFNYYEAEGGKPVKFDSATGDTWILDLDNKKWLKIENQ